MTSKLDFLTTFLEVSMLFFPFKVNILRIWDGDVSFLVSFCFIFVSHESGGVINAKCLEFFSVIELIESSSNDYCNPEDNA